LALFPSPLRLLVDVCLWLRRDVPPERVVDAVEHGMRLTGYNEFSLLSLSCSDYLSLPSVGLQVGWQAGSPMHRLLSAASVGRKDERTNRRTDGWPCTQRVSVSSTCAQIKNRLKDDNVSLSLPSQRVDRFDANIANIVGNGMKRSGLTFAPEVRGRVGWTDRLGEDRIDQGPTRLP
jgi:hypothetical protein